MREQAIALNRFGLGRRADEPLPADPRAWLKAQFARYDPAVKGGDQLAGRAQIAGAIAAYAAEQRMARAQRPAAGAAPAAGSPAMTDAAGDMAGGAGGQAMATDQATGQQAMDQAGPRRPRRLMPRRQPAGSPDAATDAAADPAQMAARAYRQAQRAQYIAQVGVRTRTAVLSDTPFVERMVHFWSNHFAVSVDKQAMIAFAGLMEFEAIRPHVLGRFEDMLVAVVQHPAMLLYLDQAQSIGPDSPLGARVAARGGARQLGLNENLAREILELHTLGVRTGYSQADVTDFARALTGWTVAGLGRPQIDRVIGADGRDPGAFTFAAALHQPGARTIMGKSYAEGGEGQARAILVDLAVHPATARHVATQIARHFAADDPPPALVARLEAAFLASRGDLATVYRALIDAPEAWAATDAKFRTPWDWSLAAFRALHGSDVGDGVGGGARNGGARGDNGGNARANAGIAGARDRALAGLYTELGQPVWRPGSPAGYDDIAASWAGPDALLRRVDAAQRLAGQTTPGDPRALAASLFPASVSAATSDAIARADSPGQGLALLLVSPEMLRR